MQTFLYPLLSFVMIGALVLRFFLFRPHWLANIITFFVMLGCIIPIAGNTLPREARMGIAFGVGIIILCVHLPAKWYDKKRAAKKAARQAPPPPAVPTAAPTVVSAVVPPVTPAVAHQPLIKQTLTTCLRCTKPLQGPICTSCGFNHTAEPIFFLSPVDAAKLQIPTKAPHQ